MAGLIQQAAGMQQGQQPRKASQEEQAMFNLAIKQAGEFLESEDQIDALVSFAQKQGIPKAIANFVKRTLDGIYTSAGSSGVDVASYTMSAAAEAVATRLTGILVAAGMAEEVKPIVEEAMNLMEQMQ